MERKTSKTELQLTIAGIHALWQKGAITTEKHNEWCRQAIDGKTSFEL